MNFGAFIEIVYTVCVCIDGNNFSVYKEVSTEGVSPVCGIGGLRKTEIQRHPVSDSSELGTTLGRGAEVFPY